MGFPFQMKALFRRIQPIIQRYEIVFIALLLALLISIIHWRVVFGGGSFIQGQTSSYGYQGPVLRTLVDLGAISWAVEPWAWLGNQVFAAGEIPLWNPYQGFGSPLHGNAQSAEYIRKCRKPVCNSKL